MKEANAATLSQQLSAALRRADTSATRINQAFSSEQAKPRVVAMTSDCCGSNNYENKRLAHR
ncbi:hypothetical protein [Stenotrophomonas sp. PS02300]|uniref:hypothetical protein n=1 Tax=Stenotrophomonas sp. PS02300 TaxID=2991426 RepID=UPI002499BA12|nr:hypothetical protein [Stenotrophomonas sp. PS02300]